MCGARKIKRMYFSPQILTHRKDRDDMYGVIKRSIINLRYPHLHRRDRDDMYGVIKRSIINLRYPHLHRRDRDDMYGVIKRSSIFHH